MWRGFCFALRLLGNRRLTKEYLALEICPGHVIAQFLWVSISAICKSAILELKLGVFRRPTVIWYNKNRIYKNGGVFLRKVKQESVL